MSIVLSKKKAIFDEAILSKIPSSKFKLEQTWYLLFLLLFIKLRKPSREGLINLAGMTQIVNAGTGKRIMLLCTLNLISA